MAQRRTAQQNRTSGRRAQREIQIELFPVEGNTVRQAQPLEQEHAEELRRRRERWEAEEQAQKAARRARRQRIRQMRMQKIYVAFLTACVCAVFGICFMYIHLQSQATQYKEDIAAIRAEVSDLQSDNEEALAAIETSVDLNDIMEQATDELGMTYPTSDQIITYDAGSSDTLSQYGDVSSSSGSSLLSGILGN